jgi:hypothetical protein
MVLVVHVSPPSREDATRSLRDALPPMSCCHVATMERALPGSTVMAGSISAPAIASASRRQPRQPAPHRLGPDNACPMPVPSRSSPAAAGAVVAVSCGATVAAATAIASIRFQRIAHLAVGKPGKDDIRPCGPPWTAPADHRCEP